MNVCITRTHVNAYSATFIRNQIEKIKEHARVYTVHSGRFPEKTEDGAPLNPRPFWLAQKIIKVLTGNRNNYFSHYGFKRYLRQHFIDVVLINYGPSGAFVGPLCYQLGIPFVVHFHGYDATQHDIIARFGRKYQWMFRYAASIIAVSEEMKKRLTALGAEASKVHVIPYGIDLSRFKPGLDQRDSFIVSVGRFTEKKAPQKTIEAFARLHDDFPELRLVMIGGKTGLFQECQALVKKLNLDRFVEFPGVLAPEMVAEYLRRAKIYVQHSIEAKTGDMEGTPNSILEAAACATPVVSTRHGGINEAVVHGVTGFLGPENDIDAMVENISILLRDETKQIVMGKAARSHVEINYEIGSQSTKLADILRLAIADRKEVTSKKSGR